MIRILHTADLHLGKVIYEHSLIEDQKLILEQIKTILKDAKNAKKSYSALIISGDIYDRSIPNPEAIQLFDDFLTSLKKENPDLIICLHPGNHDSATRLSYASSLLKSQNIYIATKFSDSLNPIIISKNENSKEERLALFQIPFLTTGFLHGEKDAESLRSQNEMLSFVIDKIKNVICEMEKKLGEKIPSLLSAHLFTLGGLQSDSERSILGTAEYVDAKLFSPFVYTALGHLHKCQKVIENEETRVYYSGSPLAYSFGEGEKFFLSISFDFDSKNLDSNQLSQNIEKIPIRPLRKMIQEKGKFLEFFSESKFDQHRNDYLEISLENETLIENPMQLLKTKFPYLLSIQQNYALSKREGSSLLTERKEILEKQNSFSDILESFIEDVESNIEKEKIQSLVEQSLEIQKEIEKEDCL